MFHEFFCRLGRFNVLLILLRALRRLPEQQATSLASKGATAPGVLTSRLGHSTHLEPVCRLFSKGKIDAKGPNFRANLGFSTAPKSTSRGYLPCSGLGGRPSYPRRGCSKGLCHGFMDVFIRFHWFLTTFFNVFDGFCVFFSCFFFALFVSL